MCFRSFSIHSKIAIFKNLVFSRWVCLCVWWFARSSSSWTTERLNGLTTFLHVAAWGFPALQTVAALVTRNVDPDALTGLLDSFNFMFCFNAYRPGFVCYCSDLNYLNDARRRHIKTLFTSLNLVLNWHMNPQNR